MIEYSADTIRANLSTVLLGRKIDLRREVASTNDLAKEAGRRGEPEGLVVLAEEQLRGRGRRGRVWSAPAGSSVLCSILLRPRFAPERAFYLTIGAALAIYRALGSLVGRNTKVEGAAPQAAVKWPNDVLVNGRKISGVLSESEFVGGEWAFAVVGFGINVNLEEKELAELRGFAPRATALSAEWGGEVDRVLLLARVLSEFEAIYLRLQDGQFGPVYDEWLASLETIGRRVSVNYGGGVVSGQAVRVERDGALVVLEDDGSEWTVLAGDVVG